MPKPKNSAPPPSLAVAAPAAEQHPLQHAKPRGPRVVVARSTFSGPMPPPDLVREYEAILPGAARYFFTALEGQTVHRQAIERKVIDAAIRGEKMGMWLGFALAMISILSGTFLIHEDKDPQGLSLIVGTMVSLCAVFVYSRTKSRRDAKERERKGNRSRG